MRYFTRKGDKGTSALYGCDKRVAKTEPRFEALGAVDELNSFLGICKSLAEQDNIQQIAEILHKVQENLFIVQAYLGSAEKSKIPFSQEKVEELERQTDMLGEQLPPIKSFIISGGSVLSAHLDYGRALARSVERKVLSVKELLNPEIGAYLNRLSSLMFVLARFANKSGNIKEQHPSYK